MISVAGQTARAAVKGAYEIGADVAVVAKRTVDGIIEAAREIGGNVEGIARAAVGGAIESAGAVGDVVLKSVKGVLGGVVEGVKGFAECAASSKKSGAEAGSPPDRTASTCGGGDSGSCEAAGVCEPSESPETPEKKKWPHGY